MDCVKAWSVGLIFCLPPLKAPEKSSHSEWVIFRMGRIQYHVGDKSNGWFSESNDRAKTING